MEAYLLIVIYLMDIFENEIGIWILDKWVHLMSKSLDD